MAVHASLRLTDLVTSCRIASRLTRQTTDRLQSRLGSLLAVRAQLHLTSLGRARVKPKVPEYLYYSLRPIYSRE
jgi:hypothetical protein